MKKFFEEFGDFLKQGNLIEIAVGLLLATAFMSLVTAFSNSFIMPIVNKLLGFANGTNSYFIVAGMKFTYGSFLSALFSFIIVCLVLFFIVKAYNKLINKSKDDAQVDTEISLLKDIKELLEKK